MSVEEITAILYRCRCELPGCPGKRAPWDTLAIPRLCRWCRRRNWNGEAGRQRGRPAKLPTPYREMTVDERRAYNREAVARSRGKRKEQIADQKEPMKE